MQPSISKTRSIAWGVWIVASIFYAFQYIIRVMPNVMLSDIMEQFQFNPATFGQFSGVYYISYSLMHLPIGMMLDRFGPRKVMTGCIILTVIGLTPLLFAKHWMWPIAGRFLIGLGSSSAILGVFKIIRMTFSEKLFPRMLSISVTIGLIGAIWGGGPISYIRDVFGYQSVVQLLSFAGLALAAITYWIVPDVSTPSQGTAFGNIKEVLSNKRVVFSCIFAGMMVGPLEGFADVWATIFLKNVYTFDNITAASIPSMIFIGMCFGGPILSFTAEKVGSYLGTIVAAGLIMGVSFAAMIVWAIPHTFLSMSFVVVGICSAYQILAIYKASTYVREEVAGLTTAVANMIIMFFGYAFHSAIGAIVNTMGGTESSEALVYGVGVIPVALFIGALGFLFMMIAEKSKENSEVSQTA